jgi:hypothetical protein
MRQLQQHVFETNHAICETSCPRIYTQFVERYGVTERELAHGCADNFRKVRASSLQFAQVVCQRANVRSRSAFHHEPRNRAFHTRQSELIHFNFDGLEIHRFVLSRELVRWAAMNLFGGEWRRRLLALSNELCGERRNRFALQRRRRVGSRRHAIGVVCVRGKSKTHGARVAFPPANVETGQPCGAPKSENQHACRQRIESAEMPDLPETRETPDRFDNIMRSSPAGLVYDKDSVDLRRL